MQVVATLSVRSSVSAVFPSVELGNGLRQSLLHPFYTAHPKSCPFPGVRGWLTELQWPSTLTFINDYPADATPGWSNNVQGVAHDGNHWYFVQQDEFIWKIPITRDLGAPVAFDPPHGVPMPAALALLGYDHMGDPDVFEDHLYVPLEANEADVPQPPRICLFDANSLAFRGSAILNAQGGVPWCAVHPVTGDLFSSAFDATQLQVYRRAVLADTAGQSVGLELTHVGGFTLHDGGGARLDLARVQGGAFSAAGHLYLACDADDHGVMAFDMVCGRRVFDIPKSSLPAGSEVEGLTILDLDDTQAPGIRGQVHMLWLNDDVSTDQMHFSHFRVPAGQQSRV